jgi:hypothetical protein
MPIKKNNNGMWCLPKFKTSAGLAPDISSASTVASGIELTDLQVNIKKVISNQNPH